jgi:hypothetical protein
MNALSSKQADLLARFYGQELSPISLNKIARDRIWDSFKRNKIIEQESVLLASCPALVSELHKSIDSGKNIQSAVFSECVYAQSLANHFQLPVFRNETVNPLEIDSEYLLSLKSMGLVPRYTYSNYDSSIVLVQAGGSGGVDSALISKKDNKIFTIEFKEPGAKTTEADLPKYGEDGFLQPTELFKTKHPQFTSMVEEQFAKNLNYFARQGTNVNDFSMESLKSAVNSNYQGLKFADTICTEDRSGKLTMIPSDEIDKWARLEGEVRPAGRNSYKAWTQKDLSQQITSRGGQIVNKVVTSPLASLSASKPRGGTGTSRYKIGSLYFVRSENVEVRGLFAEFNIDDVRQLIPTIAAKMFFENLDSNEVRDYYKVRP